jgi:hypothetical protein
VCEIQEKSTTRNRRENRAKSHILLLKKERRADKRRAFIDVLLIENSI